MRIPPFDRLRHLQNLQVDLRTDVPNQVMNAWSGDLIVSGGRDMSVSAVFC